MLLSRKTQLQLPFFFALSSFTQTRRTEHLKPKDMASTISAAMVFSVVFFNIAGASAQDFRSLAAKWAESRTICMAEDNEKIRLNGCQAAAQIQSMLLMKGYTYGCESEPAGDRYWRNDCTSKKEGYPRTSVQMMLADALSLPPGASACFRRDYDRAHLAAHPHQLVTSMSLLIENQRFERGTQLLANLRVRIRGRSGVLRQGVSCNWSGDSQTGLTCAVDCDGGGFVLERSTSPDSIRLRLDVLDRGIALAASCGEPTETSYNLTAGRDDAVFRLDRTRVANCN